MNRNLDSCYFRVQRNDKWENICFTDLTIDERDKVTFGRDAVWWKSLAYYLADIIKDIGDTLDIMGDFDDEEAN